MTGHGWELSVLSLVDLDVGFGQSDQLRHRFGGPHAQVLHLIPRICALLVNVHSVKCYKSAEHKASEPQCLETRARRERLTCKCLCPVCLRGRCWPPNHSEWTDGVCSAPPTLSPFLTSPQTAARLRVWPLRCAYTNTHRNTNTKRSEAHPTPTEAITQEQTNTQHILSEFGH